MKIINRLAYLFIILLLVVLCFSILTNKQFFPNFVNNPIEFLISKTTDFITIVFEFFQSYHSSTPHKDIVDYIITIVGFIITALGFIFVVFQISALATQITKQEEQYHKDSEFKNFLEATKMLTSTENENNATAQISAMYLLYDYAKNHSKHDRGNLEKVMKVLNRYATPAIYDKKDLKCTYTENFNNTKNIVDNRKTINEWKEYGDPYQQVAIIALELNKKLFVYALEHKTKINLSNIIIFDFDIERDINNHKKFKLFDITKSSTEITFLCCKFSDGNKKSDFSTGYFLFSRGKPSKKSVKGRMDISLSRFIKCDLNGCDFSYSNLWGVTFENCKLKDTKFIKSECLGSEFIYKDSNDYPIKIDEKISEVHLQKMLFIDNDFFKGFRETLKYAVVYSTNEACFINRAESEKFIIYKNKTVKEKINFSDKIKLLLCQKLCGKMEI